MTADEVPPDKVCTKCGTADAGFTKHKRMKDGLQAWCRACKNDPELVRAAYETRNPSKLKKAQAKHRGLQYNLDHAAVNILLKGPCFYCAYDPRDGTITSSRGRAVCRNGLDRIDSALGYEPNNVVVCCMWCNASKNNHTVAQFRDHVTRIHQTMSAKNWQVVPAFTNQTPAPVEPTTTSTSTSPFSFEWFNDAAD
jgi:hypothetical protein